jgi:hypothetical protein
MEGLGELPGNYIAKNNWPDLGNTPVGSDPVLASISIINIRSLYLALLNIIHGGAMNRYLISYPLLRFSSPALCVCMCVCVLSGCGYTVLDAYFMTKVPSVRGSIF